MRHLLKIIAAFSILAVMAPTQSVSCQTLYKVSLFRAAPAALLPLIDDLKERVEDYQAQAGAKPFIVRHSQGDQWDLMVYEHITSYAAYFDGDYKLNEIFTPPYGNQFYNLISFHETVYSYGPDYSVLSSLFEQNSFFHVEMFVALPGKQKELLGQRKMENVYLQEVGRGENLIFIVDQGASWDCFTLGGYRDIKHFAESVDIPIETEEKAAIKAGFKGVTHISPYLRSLITMHHDTLGGKVE